MTDAPRWELYSHGADVGVRGTGTTLAEAFEWIAVALTSAVCDVSTVRPSDSVSIHCEASDPEALLYEWINALVYEMATRHMLFSRFRVSIDGTHLAAEAWGEALDVGRHEPGVEVKGATYTDLRIARSDTGVWTAQCIVDV